MEKAVVKDEPQFLGHPPGLYVLFFTEMWERFSYYGMRALLMLYMTQYLLFEPEKAASVLGYDSIRWLLESSFGPLGVQPMASQIYGLYTGFVYLTPLFGGIIADKVWGQRKTVYVGGILMAIGHFLMAFDHLFLFALFFLIIGNGAFKPNISTQVGNLYPDGDPRKDGAFTIFYMGINLGAFLSPLVCGTLGQVYGWHYGFNAAGIGMVLGLAFYHFGRHYLPTDSFSQKMNNPDDPLAITDRSRKIVLMKILGGFTLFTLGFLSLFIIPHWLKVIFILAVIALVVHYIRSLPEDERYRVGALILLCLGTITFWAAFEQQGNTLQLWADSKTRWEFLGWTVPSTWYQSFNPAFIFLFAPLLNMYWERQIKKGLTPSTSVRKMGIGSLLCGAAFLFMILAAKVVPADERGSLMWLVMTTWLFTMGELYLSPIGLSLVTKVSPPRMVSMMMGMWFLSSFFGNYASGFLGSFYAPMKEAGQLDLFFASVAMLGIATGVFFFLAEKRMVKIIGKV